MPPEVASCKTIVQCHNQDIHIGPIKIKSNSITTRSPMAPFIDIHTSLPLLMSQISAVQSLNCVQLSARRWTAAHQASLSITSSQSLLKLMTIKSVMPSNHLIFYRPLLLLPSVFPRIRVFSNESVLCISWPK